MSDNGNPIIFSPNGGRFEFGQQQDDRARHVTKGIREWFVKFADFLTFHALGLHCGVCHVTIQPTKFGWRHWGECSGHKAASDTAVGQAVVKTDDGLAWITGRRVPRVELKAAQMEWLRQAEDVCPHFALGIHCEKCQGDVAGLNSERDAVYSATCGCREFIGANRDFGGFAVASETRH